jgi:hypothetical protein
VSKWDARDSIDGHRRHVLELVAVVGDVESPVSPAISEFALFYENRNAESHVVNGIYGVSGQGGREPRMLQE